MSNHSKQKGTSAETAVVKHLINNGFPEAERRTLSGANDKGDISGIKDVCLEVKDHKKINLAGWIKELEVERRNALATTGAVIHKKRGTLNVGEWYATIPVWVYIDLLIEAGY